MSHNVMTNVPEPPACADDPEDNDAFQVQGEVKQVRLPTTGFSR